MLTDKAGKINSGSIVYFQPSDGKKVAAFPKNTFKNIFSGKAVAVDGTYKMATLAGTLMSHIGIKKGKLFSTGKAEKKNKANGTTQRTGSCTAYYWITTYYYSDGTTETTEEYLYTVCGGCHSEYMSPCQDEMLDSGGGSGGGEEEAEDPSEQELEGHHEVPGEVELLDAAPDQSSASYGPSGNPTLPYVWFLYAKFLYTNAFGGRFPWVKTSPPVAIPNLFPYIDRNNNPASIAVSVGPWDYASERVAPKSLLVIWKWNYQYIWYRVGQTTYSSWIPAVGSKYFFAP